MSVAEAVARPAGLVRTRVSHRVSGTTFHLLLLPALAVCIVAGIAIGSVPLRWDVVLRVFGLRLLPAGWLDAAAVTQADRTIVWLIRLPRVLVAAIVGAGLATAGVIMQALFRNPLAEPTLTGVGPGAVLGAVAVFVTGWSTYSVVALPLAAMATAVIALAMVYAIATRGGVTPISTLLLAGIAVGALFTAVSSLLISINIVTWQTANQIVFWMMGGLDARTWAHVWLSGPFVLIGVVTTLAQARDLDLLLLGEEQAASLGVNVEAAKRLLIFTAALLTGASVAVAGLIGFVGLFVPHAVRLLVGPSHRVLVPAAAIAGAAFLIGCDLLARTLQPPVEIRLGIVTGLVGAPFFLFLLIRRLQEARG
jgi:iron complex transport system permease protein